MIYTSKKPHILEFFYFLIQGCAIFFDKVITQTVPFIFSEKSDYFKMASDHNSALDQLCRLCACLPKRKFSKIDKADGLKKFFDIVAHKEDQCIYPSSLCLNCFRKISKLEQGKSSNLSPVSWHKHSDVCDTCERIQQLKKGGRKAKLKIHHGRPKSSLHNITLADVMSLDFKRPIPQAVKNAVGHIISMETKKSSDLNKMISLPVNNGQKVVFCFD